MQRCGRLISFLGCEQALFPDLAVALALDDAFHHVNGSHTDTLAALTV
jgi:hypothetical protein